MDKFMQNLTKKLLRLLIVLCIILPLNGMFKFNPKTFQRLKRVQQTQKRTIETSPPNININQPTIPKNTGFFSWLSNWWSGPPLEEKLSTLSTNVGTTIKTAAVDISTTIKSNKILATLHKDHYVSDKLTQEIQLFLENNNTNTIKNVFDETIKYLGGSQQLIKICKNNPSIAIKILPLLQEPLANPVYTTTKSNNAITGTGRTAIESRLLIQLTSQILLQLSDTTDTAQLKIINEIKQRLLNILDNQPSYISSIDTAILLDILPDDIDSLISIINKWQKTTGSQDIQVFYYVISSLLAQKIMNEKNEENKEKLYEFIAKKSYVDKIIENITPDKAEVITKIILALKKEFSPNKITNLYSVVPNILNLASQNNPSLAMDIVNETVSTLQKKMLADEIYTDNFHLMTKQILYFTSKNDPSLTKNFSNEIIDVLKDKLLTGNFKNKPNIMKQNFYSLIETILKFALKNNPSLAQNLTATIITKLDDISESSIGANFLVETLPTDEIISTLQKKMSTDEIYTDSFRLLTKEILDVTPSLPIKGFINEITTILNNKLLSSDFYTNTINSENIYSLIKDVLYFTSKNNPSLAENLTNTITDQYENISRSSTGLKFLTDIFPGSEILEKVLNIKDEYKDTASYKHLKKYLSEIKKTLPTVLHDPHLITMIQDAIKKEKELNDLGYVTFYHGRRWKYNFLSDLYSMLFKYKSGKKLDDFIFTHLDDPVLKNKKINPLFFTSQKKTRERLIQKGNIFADETVTSPMGLANRQTLLFLNKYLFGNTNRGMSNTISYVLSNENAGAIDFPTEEVFAMFGESDIYHMYEQKLQNLQQKHTELTPYGELLLIAIPKKNLDKSIYYTTSGGPQIAFNIPGIGKTTNTTQIVNYLDNNPEDVGEFVGITTKDEEGILNPDSGTKVFSFNAADPKKYNKFKEEENALSSEIEQSMKEKDSKKRMEAASRE